MTVLSGCENKIPDDQVEKSERGSAQMSELVLCTIVIFALVNCAMLSPVIT